jgi:hypothetical protein
LQGLIKLKPGLEVFTYLTAGGEKVDIGENKKEK